MIETDLAYAAGIVDGEGYVGIKKSKAYACQGRKTPGYHARVQVRMVDQAALELLARLFGGHLYAEKLNILRVRQPLHCWSLSDASAEAALRRLLPYLRIKDRVANVVLQLRALQADGRNHRTKVTGRRNFPNKYGKVRVVENRSFSDEYVARCENFWSRCRTLNHAPGWANSSTA